MVNAEILKLWLLSEYLYTLSNVIPVDENFTSFHQYLRYCHKVLPLCSPYHTPSYEPKLTLLVPFPSQLAHLCMLFIIEMVCSADHLNNR